MALLVLAAAPAGARLVPADLAGVVLHEEPLFLAVGTRAGRGVLRKPKGPFHHGLVLHAWPDKEKRDLLRGPQEQGFGRGERI